MHQSTAVNGIIYSWAKVEQPDGGYFQVLVSLTMDGEDCNSLILKSLNLMTPHCGYVCIHRMDHLVESCSQLYHVGIFIRHGGDYQITVIKVWELDLHAMNWVEMKCLNGRAFFLTEFGCTWCLGCDYDPLNNSSSSREGFKGNYIYFLDDDDILCSYSFADRSVTESQTFPQLQTPVTSVIWLNVAMKRDSLPAIQYRNEHPSTHAHVDEENVENDETRVTDESLLITNLPPEMLRLISEYLHLFDYGNFRASCKKFQSTVLRLPLQKTDNLLPSPLFISFTSDDGWCQMMDLSRNSSCRNRLQLSLEPFTVDFSKDGWIIIHRSELESLKFLNPFTRVSRELPNVISLSELRSIGFSTHPDSPDCVTVLFDNYFDESVIVYYFRNGEENWTRTEFENEEKFWPGKSCPVYLAGSFYVLGIDGRLGEFKIAEDGEEHWYLFNSPVTVHNTFHSYHLVACDGDLVSVFIGSMGYWVEVFVFKIAEINWYKVTNLGDNCLFISNPSSFSTKPTEVWMRDRIYFPRLKGNRIIFYSLETDMFHVSGSEDDIFEDFLGTTMPLHCFWY